jgi:hypothetical protein
VVDLTDVSFMDCSALRILLALSERCAESGARFLLSGPTAIVSRLLNALQLDQVFVITGTAAEAVALAETWTELGELPPELVPARQPAPPPLPAPAVPRSTATQGADQVGDKPQVSNNPQVVPPATWQPRPPQLPAWQLPARQLPARPPASHPPVSHPTALPDDNDLRSRRWMT